MKNDILANASKTMHKVGFAAKKHSPEILIVAGVIGTVASAVMACHATTKIDDILSKTKEDIDTIHSCAENEELSDNYSAEDAKKDLAIVYAQTGVKLAKLYAPSVALGILSLTSVVASNNILRKRNVALAAAYATMDKSFKEYRSHVVERFGDQVDHELRYGIKAKRFEEVAVDENTGKQKKVKNTVEVAGPVIDSDYARFFDNSSPSYEEDTDYNMMFLRAQQNYANDKLKAKGYLFLNEVYNMLGIPETRAGQVVGWRYDPKNADIDNYVDFGIFKTNRELENGGYEQAILLDFNVDGNILDLCW